MKTQMYVLSGIWATRQDSPTVKILGVSANLEALCEKLNELADSKAEGYVKMYGYVAERRTERHYSISSGTGYAEFHISEHLVEFPENVTNTMNYNQNRNSNRMDEQEVTRYIASHAYISDDIKDTVIDAIKDAQRYRAIEERLLSMFGGSLPLNRYVDLLEEMLTEPDKPNPVNARILTYEEADMWDAYKQNPEQIMKEK